MPGPSACGAARRPEAVKEGKLSIDAVDACARRVLDLVEPRRLLR